MTTAVLAATPAVTAHEAPERMAHSDLDRVIDEHKKPLMRYVLRLTSGDLHLAEDIVQETLLRVWQRPKTITTRHNSIRPWLFTVAKHLAYDHRRAQNARPTEVYGATTEDKPTVADHMDDTLVAHDMALAMKRLSPEQRVVLAYVYYRGKSLADTAAELGLPLGTVKSRIYYALRALREIVDELGITLRPAVPNQDLPRAS